MLTAYILSLMIGGGLLVASLFGDLFGGADADADALSGGDFGGDADLASGGDLAPGADGAGAAADASEGARLFSLRSATYALFGFGGSGLVLHLAWSGGSALLAGLIAGAMGLGSSALASAVFGYLKRTEAGAIPGQDALVGLRGEVILPIADGDTGEVKLRSGERRFRMRARLGGPGGRSLPEGGEPVDALAAGRAVVVTEVEGGVAYVAPLGPEETKLLKD